VAAPDSLSFEENGDGGSPASRRRSSLRVSARQNKHGSSEMSAFRESEPYLAVSSDKMLETRPTRLPFASIVICTRNRAPKLRAALEAVLALHCPENDYEVIVVDNASTDHTLEVCAGVEPRFEGRLRVVSEAAPGQGAARNAGIRAARGEIIAFMDDDIFPQPDWLATIRREFSSDPTLGAISGRVELFDPKDLPMTIRRQTERIEFSSVSDAFNLFVGCNEAIKKSLIEQVGFYDTDFGPGGRFISADDSDFIYRAWKAGHKLIYVPSLFVYHNHGRRTQDAGTRLRRGYVLGRGAFYAKHILGGDRLALQAMYWELVSTLRSRSFKTYRHFWWLFQGFVGCCLVRAVRLVVPSFGHASPKMARRGGAAIPRSKQ
jgi:GT2 family glycosyltransferase